jgi:hypothetical protein
LRDDELGSGNDEHRCCKHGQPQAVSNVGGKGHAYSVDVRLGLYSGGFELRALSLP